MGQAKSKTRKQHSIKKVQKFEAKEEYFIKNGAILLEHQIEISKGREIGSRELKIFSSEEIEKATNNYDPDLVFSRGKTVIYKATLESGHVVSVMAPPIDNPNIYLTNMLLLGTSKRSVMNHENMLKIYGCCLETNIPMLVAEYFPNRTLFDHLHGDNAPSNCMLWSDHLRVMTEVAYALSYMHNALPKPLVHRNIMSSSIYLDYSFRAKLSRFGYAVSITPGDTSQRWSVEGTNTGYIDPEYIETRVVTDKCDVYSFGILMIEILTRRQPLTMARAGINLADVFASAEEKTRIEMINSKVLEQYCWDEIQQVVELALACVVKKGTNRPTMIDVVQKLRKIHDLDKKRGLN